MKGKEKEKEMNNMAERNIVAERFWGCALCDFVTPHTSLINTHLFDTHMLAGQNLEHGDIFILRLEQKPKPPDEIGTGGQVREK